MDKKVWKNNNMLTESSSYGRNYSLVLTFESEYDRNQAYKILKGMKYPTYLLEQAMKHAYDAPRYLERFADSREALLVDYESDLDPSQAILEFLDKVEKEIPRILNIWDEDSF